MQVQQRLYAHSQLVQKLQLLLGVRSLCELLYQPPTAYTTPCTAISSGAHAGHDLPALQLEVRTIPVLQVQTAVSPHFVSELCVGCSRTSMINFQAQLAALS